jgi:hypothetical protein
MEFVAQCNIQMALSAAISFSRTVLREISSWERFNAE